MLSHIYRGENENNAIKRKRQINTLKIFNDNVIELKEDDEYQVQFDAGNKRMAILVSLPSEFPLEKPVLRISPIIIHPWCNKYGEIISAPGLLNFTVHSDLGRVVQAIIREFSKNPPELLDENSTAQNLQLQKTAKDLPERTSPCYSLQGYTESPSTSLNSFYNYNYPQLSSTNANSNTYNLCYMNSDKTCNDDNNATTFPTTVHSTTYSNNSQGNLASLNDVSGIQYSPTLCANVYSTIPCINSNFTQPGSVLQSIIDIEDSMFLKLEQLSTEELKTLNDDNEVLYRYVEKHPQLRDIDTAIEDAIEWVEKMAVSNITKEQQLEKLKNNVIEKLDYVKQLKNQTDKLSQQYNVMCEIFTPKYIKECLKRAADVSNEHSEKIADEFLNGKIDVDNFLNTYIECRKLGQIRRTKEEKLSHQLNELKRAGY